MKIYTPSILIALCLFVFYKETDALFGELFKATSREKLTNGFFDDQYSFYLKDSKPKLSENQRTIIVNLATFAIRKIHSYNFTAYTDANETLHSMRAIGKELGLSTRTVGGLALFSLFGYGTFASIAPDLRDEISRKLSKEERDGMRNLVTGCLVGMSDSLMKWVEGAIDDLPSLPRLNAQECMKRSICEAHNQPRRYGLFGLGLQLFFPPYIENSNETRRSSKYQMAANYGRQNQNCNFYDDCFFSVMDMAKSLANLIF